MSLNAQFLIIATLPASFILMSLYTWQAKPRRRFVFTRWIGTLLLGALWASSTLRTFSGDLLGQPLLNAWEIVGDYAFVLTIIGLLITTFRQMNSSMNENRLTVGVALLLWGGAFALDPRLWQIMPNGIELSGQMITQSALWLGTWVASWVVPIMASFILTQRLYSSVSRSLFRNLLNYWLLMLIIFTIASVFNSIQQENQPGIQQLGVLLAILAASIGTFAITRSQLPDLPLAVRRLSSRLSGFLVLFGFSLIALNFLVQIITSDDVQGMSQTLLFVLSAALFSILFAFVYRVVVDLSRRIFLPAMARQNIVESEYANTIGNVPEPKRLGLMFLKIIQSNFGTDDAWVFEASDGAGGRLILRPLAHIGSTPPSETVDLPLDDPVALALRNEKQPLVQYDIDSLERFSTVSSEMRDILSNWKRNLFMPLHAGDSLIGVLALGEKQSGEAYQRPDIDKLRQLGAQMSPLLAQAQNIASLQQINGYVFQQNQLLTREKRQLQELATLYRQFFDLISPELLQPFATADQLVQQLPTGSDQTAVSDLINAQYNELKRPFDHLITLANRISEQETFHFEPVQMNDVLETAVQQLEKMATARRVKIEFEPLAAVPRVLGDREQLLEAVQHLLHNAVKFNKIGGVVQINCMIEGGEIAIKIADTGVGMSDERLETLWDSLTTLNKSNRTQGTGRGTGLGLALTRFIVAAHGGEIKVQTKYGSGSVFTLLLPPILE